MSYTISRKSWHWKLYAYYLDNLTEFGYSHSASRVCLCPYMRTLLVWLPLRFFAFRIMPGVAAAFSLCLCGLLAYEQTRRFLLTVALVAGIAGVAYVALRIQMWHSDRQWERHWRRETSQPVQPQEPGLLGQWLKAKHEKICPCFEVRD